MSITFNISGVKEWHDKGYKGKGINVLIAEPDPTTYHAKSVKEIIQSYSPEANIIMYDYDCYKEVGMIDFAIKNKVDIINTSYGIDYPDGTFIETRAKDAYKRALDAGIIIVNSSGNEGEGRIKGNGVIDDRIINVGMVDRDLQVPVESSHGNGQVDCGGLVGHILNDGTILWGTSEAAPYVTGLLSCLLSKEKLTLKQVLVFIAKNSIPINEKVGTGLFRLPSYKNPLAVDITKQNGASVFIHKDFVLEKVVHGYKIS